MPEAKPIKVLMFGWEFPPYNSGGLGVACSGLARHLVKNGVDVVFVLPKNIPVSSDFMKIVFAEKKPGTFFKTRMVETLLSGYIDPTGYRAILQKTVNREGKCIYGATLYDEVLRYSELSREIAQNEDFDIIHAHDWLSFSSGIEAKQVSGKPLIVHVHATEFDRSGGNSVNQKVYDIERKGLRKADGIIAVSNYTKNILVQHYDVSPHKVNVVHNGVGEENVLVDKEITNKLHNLKNSGTKIVLYVGRLTLQKGVDYFLKSAAQVLKYDKNITFLISGSGDMEKQLIYMVAKLGISDKVLFTGWLKGAELIEVYRAADLLVMPSVSEPFGLIPLESMMNGTPALISKQSGVSEAISHVLKVDFWDTDEITNKILAVLKNDSLQEHLSNEGEQEVKKINWHEAAKSCISVYNKFCFQT
ncbi:MAG: glycosyltransferase family 4 protein [Patescibacteria group bacterium]|nr:glycosyltransferase family 4 protein [Patescibacteria group bacterium]